MVLSKHKFKWRHRMTYMHTRELLHAAHLIMNKSLDALTEVRGSVNFTL